MLGKTLRQCEMLKEKLLASKQLAGVVLAKGQRWLSGELCSDLNYLLKEIFFTQAHPDVRLLYKITVLPYNVGSNVRFQVFSVDIISRVQ